MYLKEVNGFFTESKYEIISNNRNLNGYTVVIVDSLHEELQLCKLETIEANCTTKEFNDLLESIKFIWESEYSDYNIEFWRTESNAFFLKWLGVENFKDYC